jgi:hypothetical protein
MNFKLNLPGFEHQNLELTPRGFWDVEISLNGEPVKLNADGYYYIRNNAGAFIPIKVSINFFEFFDPVPRLLVDKKVIKIAPSISLPVILWVLIPTLALLAGGILGLFLGCTASRLNGKIIRSKMPGVFKFFMTLFITIMALVLYLDSYKFVPQNLSMVFCGFEADWLDKTQFPQMLNTWVHRILPTF